MMTNNQLADALLDLLDRRYADDSKKWWQLLAAYRNAGGSLERFQQWSRTEKYDVPDQVSRGWENCRLSAGIGTLVHYAMLSVDSPKVNNLQKQYDVRKPPARISLLQRQTSIVDVEKARKVLIEPWAGTDVKTLEHELSERSSVPITWKPGASDLLAVLDFYNDDEKISMPINRHDASPPDTARWLRDFLKINGQIPEFMIPNPHCGEMKNKKNGEASWRLDACFIRRFAIIEFDEMPLDDQMRLWLSLIDRDIRPAAMIFSGSKSIHAWLPAATKSEVAAIFKCLQPLGADPATKNIGRLSRTPGACREDKNRIYQKLLFLGDVSK